MTLFIEMFTLGEEITEAELGEPTKPAVGGKGIVDLSGLEYYTNLTTLTLAGNPVGDVSPLSSLTNLTELRLVYNGQKKRPKG